jgi:hypothetical protein
MHECIRNVCNIAIYYAFRHVCLAWVQTHINVYAVYMRVYVCVRERDIFQRRSFFFFFVKFSVLKIKDQNIGLILPYTRAMK